MFQKCNVKGSSLKVAVRVTPIIDQSISTSVCLDIFTMPLIGLIVFGVPWNSKLSENLGNPFENKPCLKCLWGSEIALGKSPVGEQMLKTRLCSIA